MLLFLKIALKEKWIRESNKKIQKCRLFDIRPLLKGNFYQLSSAIMLFIVKIISHLTYSTMQSITVYSSKIVPVKLISWHFYKFPERVWLCLKGGISMQDLCAHSHFILIMNDEGEASRNRFLLFFCKVSASLFSLCWDRTTALVMLFNI